MLIDFRQLFPKYGIKPKGVLHVGANVGEEAPIYDELGIKRVCWVEAHPDIYFKLQNNIAKYPNQFAMKKCVGDENGKEVIFHVSNNGSQSSSILELGDHKAQHPDVHWINHFTMTTERIDSFFNTDGEFDFLNIDLQGAELLALKGMGDMLNDFKWAYIEVNKSHVYENCALIEDIDFYLGAYGFQRVETKWASANLTWGDALYVKS
jgi:FkbM family methyltransferase